MAAIAGINMTDFTSSTQIPYTLYPKVLESLDFQKRIIHTKLEFSEFDEPISLYDYYTTIDKPDLLGYIKRFTIQLPEQIIKMLKSNESEVVSSDINDDFGHLTFDELSVIRVMNNQLEISVNEFDGYVKISASLPDPNAAADLVLKAQEELQNTIILLKSAKAQEKLEFIQERYYEKKNEYELIQDSLAKLRDKNFNLTTQSSKVSLERLESEYDVVRQVYTELSTQLETQKIQVKEDTPLFMTIEPVFVPIQKSKPKRLLIVILWTIFGVIFGFGFVLFKPILQIVTSKFHVYLQDL
ncbi:GNVR domain-containing protein [Roseivirga seohaensis]|uniref:GNVR domain-containing protein n=1 Tax=Roseivirga seohaensis TaxID=1914963 RepID=UPI00159EBD2E|nr:GNVR domain-containing protein [Roseivirga seohaensis]